MRRFALICLAASIGAGADLKSRIDAAISNTPAVANAFVGIHVVSLASGKTLYAHNPNYLFVPASNMKLFTTALALIRLGPEYRFRTQIGSDSELDASGVLAGDLALVGAGDPSLSGREYPYQYHPGSSPNASYSLRAIDELADQLVGKGLKQVDGDIIGDDRRYVWEPRVEGWSFGDGLWEYGAPVSALSVDDNSFGLTIRPGTHAGDLAQIALNPNFEFFSIDNRVHTESAGARKIEINGGSSGKQLHISGRIPKGDPGLTELLAVSDPAQYAAQVLREALVRRGIVIRGQAVARHRFSDEAGEPPEATTLPVVLAERTSPPLAEILRVVDKVSQNLHAEMMLREVGVMVKHSGTRQAGLEEMQEFLKQAGVSKDSYRFTDGSGLSRATLVSPAAITKLLAYMYKSGHRELWMSLLPVGGVDGTLALRFEDHPEARAIVAKTGSLGHVRAISGYANSREHGEVAFSVLVNNFDAPAIEVRRLLDQIGLALLD